MSVVAALRKTPKGQLSYERILVPSILNTDLDFYSSPILSRPHEERDFSLSNPSFGISLSTSDAQKDDFSPCGRNDDTNLQTVEPSGESCVSIGSDKSSVNLTKDVNLISEGDVNNSHYRPKDQTLSISQALSNLDIEINQDIKGKKSSKTDDCPSSSETKCNGIDNKDCLNGTSPTISHLFTPYSLTSCAILDEEKRWQLLSKQAMHKRRCVFENHEKAIRSLSQSQEEELTSLIKNLVHQRESLIDQSKQESKVKAHERLQKIKEGHEEHQKKIVTKHQQIERQKKKLEEEERERQEIEMAKLNQLKSLFKDFENCRNSFIQLRDNFELKDKLPETVEKDQEAIDKVLATLKAQLSTAERIPTIPSALIKKLMSQKEQVLLKFEQLKQHIDALSKEAKANEIKAAEQKKIEQEKLEEEKRNAQKAIDYRIQSVAHVVKESEAKKKIMAGTSSVVDSFVSNVQMKKYRFDLQRAVNTPINAISAVSGAHLRDKLQSLHTLLKGQQVQVAGKQVSAGQAPEGITFCQNLIAKMLVKKGEEQVTSNHESAFAIATVAVGLWGEFPVVGDLFLAHLQSVCPYVLPLYNLRQDGQSTQEYHKSMGYKIDENGSVEEQDKFLHRMSGVMRLYCACLVATPLKGSHPHGVEHAWMWLCRTLNMEPQPDITAAMMFDLLSVTGYLLFSEYKIQFVKLLYLIYKTYLPKLKSISVTNSIVSRLEILLENSLQNSAKVEPPKGLLPPNFWMT